MTQRETIISLPGLSQRTHFSNSCNLNDWYIPLNTTSGLRESSIDPEYILKYFQQLAEVAQIYYDKMYNFRGKVLVCSLQTVYITLLYGKIKTSRDKKAKRRFDETL